MVPEPYGVVGAIVPWNGPMMGMGQKCGPALAAGNTVVAKPPEIAPFGAIAFAELALEAGLPPGVVNVVPGGAVAGEALVRHPGVDKVSFTGGHGHRAAGDGGGGRDAHAARARARRQVGQHRLPRRRPRRGGAGVARSSGCTLLSGQGCALPTRLYVHDDVYDEVVGRLVAQVEAVTVGDPLDRRTLMGPVVTEAACERILGVIDRAGAEGAGTLLTGGARLGGELAGGYFVAPTVFGDVDHGSDLARNEIFGPVLSVLRFADEDEVVAKVERQRVRPRRLPAHPRRVAGAPPGARRSRSAS